MSRLLRNRHAFLLITALWTLAFLAVLAVTIALGTRQKIMLLSRLEDRHRAQLAAEAGIKKAVAILLDDLEDNQFAYSAKAKVRRFNNSGEFAAISIGEERADVSCPAFDEDQGKVVDRYGLCDEQAKININVADLDIMARLIVDVSGRPEDVARQIAQDIIDWRDYGKRKAEGFFSDDYYMSLQYPYRMKERNFERIDELFLVKGITPDLFEALRPFMTIFGDGRINVNSAPPQVWRALGMEPVVVAKILKARKGVDGRENTEDDHVFYRTFDIASEVSAIIKLEDKEIKQINDMNARNVWRTDSMVYSMVSRVASDGEDFKRTIEVVFNALANKYEYWCEK
ncbi:MAG: general secretion pathway protein GspK [Candidatus Omnitrophica bacterium]|nr:general secretion pathway protein GspK [Candidatus Omnitrophota bacterium]